MKTNPRPENCGGISHRGNKPVNMGHNFTSCSICRQKMQIIQKAISKLSTVLVDLVIWLEEDEVAEGLVEAEAVVVITEAVAFAVQVTQTTIDYQKTCRRGEVFRTKTEPEDNEAGQATEPECLIAACLAAGEDGQIVLAGDPMQLGPVLRSSLAKKFGFELSYLERLIQLPLYNRNETKFADHGCYDPLLVTKLIENYRSHESILKLSSKLFYHNELEVKADKALISKFTKWTQLPQTGFPVIFHGIRGEDLQEGNSPSWFNPVETVQIIRYLQALQSDPDVTLSPNDIGIITPYRKQVEKIRLLIERLGMDMVKVGSVEEFQGQERQVILISTVRSNEGMIGFDQRHTLGFLSNPTRFNVAITRAQSLLIVVGNPYVLHHDQYWQNLLEYCVENGGYTGCQLPTADSLSANPDH
ncbi:hypothetical protein ScPMuIL_008472 [Solemya velum]